MLDGDPALFTGSAPRNVRLMLPPLPSERTVEVKTIGRPGVVTIEVHVDDISSQAVVRLIGRDEAQMRQLWDSIEGSGGIPVPALDARRYGPLELSLEGRGQPGASRHRTGARDYRFEITQGRLSSASASGIGTDILFESIATASSGCEARSLTSVRASRTGATFDRASRPSPNVRNGPRTVGTVEPAN